DSHEAGETHAGACQPVKQRPAYHLPIRFRDNQVVMSRERFATAAKHDGDVLGRNQRLGSEVSRALHASKGGNRRVVRIAHLAKDHDPTTARSPHASASRSSGFATYPRRACSHRYTGRKNGPSTSYWREWWLSCTSSRGVTGAALRTTRPNVIAPNPRRVRNHQASP